MKPGGIAWGVAVGVGTVLTVIPEPATTGTGLAILAGALILGGDE